MNSMGRRCKALPSKLGIEPFHEPLADTQEQRIAIMASRYARGKDIWTGEPLKGQALDEQQGKRIKDEE